MLIRYATKSKDYDELNQKLKYKISHLNGEETNLVKFNLKLFSRTKNYVKIYLEITQSLESRPSQVEYENPLFYGACSKLKMGNI